MKNKALFALIILLTIYTRFVNLNWDQGWGFHPDENNLWGASRNVKLFEKLDPKFYAYGGFPVYLYSFFDSKVQARAISALLQTGIIGLLFLIGQKLKGWRVGFLAALIGAFSAGLIQAAHFLTVESLIGFFGTAILFCLLKYFGNDKGKNIWLVGAAIGLGLGVGTKISFAVFVLPFFVTLLKRPGLFKKAGPLLILIMSAFIFLLTNPFIFAKFQDVKSTLRYEANVAMGKLPVFYTRQFIGTIPGWFQAVHIFPFITGWLFMPIFLIGMFVISIKVRPRWVGSDLLMLLAVISALFSLLPMWTKWTRYVVQVLPVLILAAAVGADWVWEKGKIGKAIVILTIVSFLPQFLSTLNVYSNEDTRVKAAKWAEVNIPKDAKIFTEGMDLGIIPFNPIHGENITLFNFYELDEDRQEEKQKKLDSLLRESDHFILLSRRVYKNSLNHPDKFPRPASFYRSLFDGSLGYREVYETSRPESFSDPEETFEVFDNPDVIIFQKRI